jgi:hypothetical protein
MKGLSAVHKTIEYIKHIAEFKDDSFGWEVDDIENDLPAVLGHYGILFDDFSSTQHAMLKEDLVTLAEREYESEIARIYAVL